MWSSTLEARRPSVGLGFAQLQARQARHVIDLLAFEHAPILGCRPDESIVAADRRIALAQTGGRRRSSRSVEHCGRVGQPATARRRAPRLNAEGRGRGAVTSASIEATSATSASDDTRGSYGQGGRPARRPEHQQRDPDSGVTSASHASVEPSTLQRRARLASYQCKAKTTTSSASETPATARAQRSREPNRKAAPHARGRSARRAVLNRQRPVPVATSSSASVSDQRPDASRRRSPWPQDVSARTPRRRYELEPRRRAAADDRRHRRPVIRPVDRRTRAADRSESPASPSYQPSEASMP